MAVSIIKNKYIKISSVKPYNPVFIEVVYVGNVNGYLKTDIYITSAADGIVYVFTSKKDAYGDLDGGLNLYRKGNDLYLLIGDGITGMKDGGLYIRGTEISTDVIDSVDGLTFVKNICKWLLLGELQNAYDSYSLKESIETEIGVGLGVYYITQPNLASLSCIVIINYDNYQVLGMKGNLSFSVSLLKLTVVSKVGDIDINVRKILKQ